MYRRSLSLAVLGVLAGARRAFAHARLRTAEPAPDAMLDVAPKTVSISFTEALEPALSAIEVRDAAGQRFDDGAVRGEGKVLSVALKPLPPGGYTVLWRATSVDTHRTEGRYSFTLRG